MKITLASAAMLAALITLTSVPAPAFDDHDWILGDSYSRRTTPRHRHRAPTRRARMPERDRYYTSPEWAGLDRDDGNKRPVCLDHFIKIVSTEHTNKENAMEAAKKIWAATVQWEEGSQFMALDLAQEYREYCGPSSPMDTMSGRISEATNKLIGQEGQNVRCVLRAIPCRAYLERVEGRR